MEITQVDWLTIVSQFTVVGYVHPGWRLAKPLLGVIEQDEKGYYYISNEALGLYAVGFTHEEALTDFSTSFTETYQFLETQATTDPDLVPLFQEYQEYLEPKALAGRLEGTAPEEPLNQTVYILNESPANLDEASGPAGQPDSPALFTPDELFLLLSLTAEYRIKPIPNRTDLAELALVENKLKRLMAVATRAGPVQPTGRVEPEQAEAALRLAEEHFAKAARVSPDGIAISGLADGRIIEVNEQWLRLFGYSREEAIGQTAIELKLWFRQEQRQEIVSLIAEQGSLREVEVELRRKSGEVFQASLSIEVIVIAGEPCTLSIIHDVTERKQIEASLRQSEERFAKAFRSSPAALAITRLADGFIIDVNQSYLYLFGYSRTELVGQRSTELNIFVNPGERAEFVARLREQGVVRGYETVLRTKSGELRHVLLSVEIIDLEGVAHLLTLIFDITDRKQAEEKLKQTADELARSNAELQQFAYVASHDLQEPLRMVASYTQLLARRYQDQLDPEASEFIGYAVEGATRMKQLINDLLTYSRVETRGNLLRPVNTETVLERTLVNLRIALADSQGTVTHDPLPTVLADQTQLLQLFQNLIGNALKFRAEAPPQVHLSAELQGQEWLFSVRDNGIGLEPQFAERIFIIFQRLHSRAEYPGTGIGLAVCKRIVERHGGRIWVESQPGQGTTFYFTLPAATEK